MKPTPTFENSAAEDSRVPLFATVLISQPLPLHGDCYKSIVPDGGGIFPGTSQRQAGSRAVMSHVVLPLHDCWRQRPQLYLMRLIVAREQVGHTQADHRPHQGEPFKQYVFVLFPRLPFIATKPYPTPSRPVASLLPCGMGMAWTLSSPGTRGRDLVREAWLWPPQG